MSHEHENYFDASITMAQYLADRGRSSGHVLSMVDKEPERYGRWLAGNDVDRQSAAMARGAFLHARLVEPEEVKRAFAFYPNRNEATEPVMVPAIGTRGAKKGQPLKKLVPKLDERGEPVVAPQDSSPAGASLSMKTQSDHAKAYERSFLASAKGLTVVYPEDQGPVDAMVHAVRRHKIANALLTPDAAGDFAPEVTIHWTCPVTGELLQARPDAMWRRRRVWVEIKSVTVKGEDERLDTIDTSAVGRWARDGWARKSALVHDGCMAVDGHSWKGYWVVVEALTNEQLARGWVPRVSVVRDLPEVDGIPSLYQLGRNGGGGMRGYLELCGMAQGLREEGDYRAPCTRGVVERWNLPGYIESDMMLEKAPPPIKGARKMEVAHG
jgi:hypothetical protein